MTDMKQESRGPGQPTKLTPAVQAKVCAAIRKGAYAVVAAGAAGIAERTFYTWIERGEQESEGIYFEFLQAVRKAESDCEVATIEAWQQEGAGSWQSRAEFAARRFRARWGKQDARKVDATVKVEDAREGLLAKLARMAGELPPVRPSAEEAEGMLDTLDTPRAPEMSLCRYRRRRKPPQATAEANDVEAMLSRERMLARAVAVSARRRTIGPRGHQHRQFRVLLAALKEHGIADARVSLDRLLVRIVPREPYNFAIRTEGKASAHVTGQRKCLGARDGCANARVVRRSIAKVLAESFAHGCGEMRR